MLLELFGLEKRTSLVVTGAGVGQDATLNKIFGTMGQTSSGVNVTEDTAQTFAAVYRAVTLISSTIASLPLHVYRWDGTEGDKEEARDHPVFQILHRRPNPAMTSFFCRQAALAYVLLYGRHYSFIETDGRGEVVGLWPMRTPDVERTRKDGELKYDVRRVKDNDLFPRPPFRGDKPFLLANEVMELTTFDGESIIGHAREQVGEALAAQSFGGGFYAGGAQPYAVVTAPGKIDGEAFRKNWEAVHGGSKRRLAVLQNGMDVKTLSMPLNDAQFLESRKFYVTEIARWFGIPPHKLMDLERATFSNIEEQNLEWYESLIPWLEMIEQEADRQLLVGDTTDYFCEHNVDGLLRGNIVARYSAYATGIQWGWLNRNQVRRRENQNSMGEEGDVYMVPGNMTRADALSAEPLTEPLTGTPATPTEPTAQEKPEAAALKATGQDIQTLPDATLNGAQVTAAVEIVKAVAMGELPRDAGIGGLTVLLNLTPEQAAAVMGSVGAGFVAEKPEPTPAPQPNGQPKGEDKVNSTIKGAAKAGLIQAASRMLAKEAAEIRHATEQPERFNGWLDEYRAKWPARWEHGMAAAVAASKGIGCDVDAAEPVWEKRCQITAEALNELSGHAKRDELAARVTAEVDGWPTAEEIVDGLTGDEERGWVTINGAHVLIGDDGTGTESWKMTKEGFVSAHKGESVYRGPKNLRFYNRQGQLEATHYTEVAQALQLGKPVPKEVVSQYADRLRNDGFSQLLANRYPLTKE